MTYLVASSVRTDIAAVRDGTPALWRQIRRFNLPVQLALAAAEDLVAAASSVSEAAIISVSPCHSGSTDLFRWSEVVVQRFVEGNLGDMRMNPTHTLHVVDNLAMSAMAIAHRNQAYCLGLGGAAGQAWVALEAVESRLARGEESEVLLLAGEQRCTRDGEAGEGVALLFSSSPQSYRNGRDTRRHVRLLGIERQSRVGCEAVVPDSAAGLRRLLDALERHSASQFRYSVPSQDSDGMDAIHIQMEVSECAAAAV
jgi:hypothetical protein